MLAKTLSLLLGLAYATVIVTAAIAHSKSPADAAVDSIEYCLLVAIPVLLIWFPEQIGSATGTIGRGQISTETPPTMVSIMGWLFLLGLPVFAYFTMQ